MPLSFKTAGQSLLKQMGLYHRMKTSLAYDWYWRFADPHLIAERSAELEFFRENLIGFKPGDLIFDIGANRGHKTDIFLRLGARVVAVDPDESNQEILRQNFLTYRLQKKTVTLVHKAVSDRNGVETMWIDEPGSAKNTLNAKWVDTLKTDARRFGNTLAFANQIQVETVTLEQLIETYGRPIYVKIDVEGYEPSALRGLKSVVPFLSFEVNLPEFLTEAVECVTLLSHLQSSGRFSYTVDCRSKIDDASWLEADKFLQVLDACREPSVEVFWRS